MILWIDMTFRQAIDRQLEHIEAAWKGVLACHIDPEHCNQESKAHKDAVAALAKACDAMWRLKATIAEQG